MRLRRVLLTGDRNWTDRLSVKNCLEKLKGLGYGVVIVGGARGLDTIAEEEAILLGYVVEPFLANWSKYGKAAGVIRNQKMLDEGKPDLVIYFHDSLLTSRGTKDMVNRSRFAGIEVERG